MGFGLLIAAMLGLIGAALAQYIGIWPAIGLLTICILFLVGWCYCAAAMRRSPQ